MVPLKDWIQKYAEADFNRLSWLASIVTIVLMGMMWWTFWESCNPVPQEMMYLLWVTLAVYVPPKEAARWKNKKGLMKKRYGQVFAYLWFFSLIVMSFLEWKNPGRFQIPEGMGETVIGVMVIFGASTFSRKLYKYRKCTENAKVTEKPAEKPTETKDAAP